jgi:hypothetical protein
MVSDISFLAYVNFEGISNLDMLQKLLVQTYHFPSGKEKDASHIL